MPISRKSDTLTFFGACVAIAAATAALRLGFHLANPTIAALTYLLVVLIAATTATLRVAVATSVVADLCLNYFFLPPLGTFVVADPENWVALFAFLVVGVVASDLSTKARDRAAMAIERAQLLEERKAAEVARQSEELKSTLLVSLAHDLRTPLTAIRVAASNLQASWLADSDRREQSDLILSEVGRLNHLFGNILEMARIDAGAVNAEAEWVHPSEIVEAARDRVAQALRDHPVQIAVESDALVHVDPRLTAAALSQLLENAAWYAPDASPIAVNASVSSDGLTLNVRDRGPGIATNDLPHLFERFYRGREAGRRAVGTGMGLSIARGLLAAQHGRVWAENCAGGGAQFTIVVPAKSRLTAVYTS